jgi:multiple sugar transport system permease protein
VLLSTLLLGLLAGYALARLEFRGKGMVFNAMLLVLIVPFQLLMIPLYVMIVRGYLLGDTYLGMVLPFAVNATAVFIFRQFFLQLPRGCSSRPAWTGPASSRSSPGWPSRWPGRPSWPR